MILQNLLDAFCRVTVIFFRICGINAAQNTGNIQKNHWICKGTATARLRNTFWTKSGRILNQAVIQLINQMVCAACAIEAVCIAGYAIVFRVCNCVKALREAVTALPQGTAVCRNLKIGVGSLLFSDEIHFSAADLADHDAVSAPQKFKVCDIFQRKSEVVLSARQNMISQAKVYDIHLPICFQQLLADNIESFCRIEDE